MKRLRLPTATIYRLWYKDGNCPKKQRGEVGAKLVALTGLPLQRVLDLNLRINTDDFEMLLLAAEGKRIGKLDGQVAKTCSKSR